MDEKAEVIKPIGRVWVFTGNVGAFSIVALYPIPEFFLQTLYLLVLQLFAIFSQRWAAVCASLYSLALAIVIGLLAAPIYPASSAPWDMRLVLMAVAYALACGFFRRWAASISSGNALKRVREILCQMLRLSVLQHRKSVAAGFYLIVTVSFWMSWKVARDLWHVIGNLSDLRLQNREDLFDLIILILHICVFLYLIYQILPCVTRRSALGTAIVAYLKRALGLHFVHWVGVGLIAVLEDKQVPFLFGFSLEEVVRPISLATRIWVYKPGAMWHGLIAAILYVVLPLAINGTCDSMQGDGKVEGDAG